MGPTHRNTWKRREREAAALFGALRQRCSGSSGRADLGRSDSTHPRLFLEVKTQASTSTRDMLDATRRSPATPDHRPVWYLCLSRPVDGWPAIVVHSDDLDALFEDVRPKTGRHVRVQRSGVLSLLGKTEALAAKEDKTAVVLIATKNRPGFLIAFRLDAMDTIRAERRRALLGPDPGDDRGEAA